MRAGMRRKELTLTPWFGGHINPARPGVYNVSCLTEEQSGDWYARFDGKHWYGNWATHPNSSILCKPADFFGRPASWRGVAGASS
jgi:hypothetical protein